MAVDTAAFQTPQSETTMGLNEDSTIADHLHKGRAVSGWDCKLPLNPEVPVHAGSEGHPATGSCHFIGLQVPP